MPQHSFTQKSILKNLEMKRTKYQEVIERVSQELHETFLRMIGPLDSNAKKTFKKNLKSLVAHAHNPGCLSRVTNWIEHNPRAAKVTTHYVIPAAAGLGIAYAASDYPTRAADIVVRGITNFLRGILSLIPGTDEARQTLIDFHEDTVNIVQSIAVALVFYLLYRYCLLLAFRYLADGAVLSLRTANHFLSLPNPPEIIQEFTEPSKFQRELAWSFYNLFFINDEQRNSDKRLKKILTISEKGAKEFNETRHQLQAMFYELYKEIIKTYTDLEPSAFNKKGKALDKGLFKAVLENYLESVILIPAYFLKKYYYDGYKYNHLIPLFLDRIKRIVENSQETRTVNLAIREINDLLEATDQSLQNSSPDKKIIFPQIKLLFKKFNGLREQFSDSSANEKRVSHSAPFFNRICVQLKKFTDILLSLPLQTNTEDKQAVSSACNILLQKTNRFLSQAASTMDENRHGDVHNAFLPGISNLLSSFNKIHDFQQFSANGASATASPQLTKSTTDTHFSTPELELFLNSISGLLEKFTEQLPNVSTSECAGTSGKTLSKSELNKDLTDINEFLEKSTAALPSILATGFISPAQADSRRTNHKLFLNNVDDLLGKFTDLLVKVPPTQHDAQSGEKISLPELQRLLIGIKNFQAEFKNLLPLVKDSKNNPWRFEILGKLNTLTNKTGNLISQFILAKPSHIAISMPNGIGSNNSKPYLSNTKATTTPLHNSYVVIPIDESTSGKTNSVSLSAAHFSPGMQSAKPVLGDFSSESSAINGHPPRPGITTEHISQLTDKLSSQGCTEEEIDNYINSLLIEDYIYSLLESGITQAKTKITPEQFDKLVKGVKNFRKNNWTEREIKTWVHITFENFHKEDLQIAARIQLTSSSNQGNYSAHGNHLTFFRSAREQHMPEDTLELQEIVTSKPQ